MTYIQLREIFLELIKETRKRCLVVTHNVREAIEIGQRMIVLGKPPRNLLDEKIPKFSSEREKGEYEERILSVIDRDKV